MPINNGRIEATQTDSQGREVKAYVYYDPAWYATDPTRDYRLAPLVNGTRGYCLEFVNISGKVADFGIVNKDGTVNNIRIGQGDPVTTGPAAGRSRTVAQMAALGYVTRGDLPGASISAP